jgi:hypothetical protein
VDIWLLKTRNIKDFLGCLLLLAKFVDDSFGGMNFLLLA